MEKTKKREKKAPKREKKTPKREKKAPKRMKRKKVPKVSVGILMRNAFSELSKQISATVKGEFVPRYKEIVKRLSAVEKKLISLSEKIKTTRKKLGTPRAKRRVKPKCTVEGCEKEQYIGELCKEHFKLWKKERLKT